jgi:hypothetical protein
MRRRPLSVSEAGLGAVDAAAPGVDAIALAPVKLFRAFAALTQGS